MSTSDRIDAARPDPMAFFVGVEDGMALYRMPGSEIVVRRDISVCRMRHVELKPDCEACADARALSIALAHDPGDVARQFTGVAQESIEQQELSGMLGGLTAALGSVFVVAGFVLFSVVINFFFVVAGVLTYAVWWAILPLVFGGAAIRAGFVASPSGHDGGVTDVFWRIALVLMGVLIIVGGYAILLG